MNPIHVSADRFSVLPKSQVKTIGIGMFDGVHRGHQDLLALCDAMITFDPHPRQFFNPSELQLCLTPLSEKQALFRHVIALKFDQYLSRLSPVHFLNFIHHALQPKKIVVGYDFRYGNEKQGDADQLVCWGKESGVEIQVKSPFLEKGSPIKSSWIRDCIQTGDIRLANHLLGRPYCLIGRVESGEKRGRTIGYPTANIQLNPSKFLPKEGVYSGDVIVLGVKYRAAISIGHKPSFNAKSISVEVHIIGFSGDLYGHTLNVELKSFIRDQYTFNSLNELQHQIQQDVAHINSL